MMQRISSLEAFPDSTRRRSGLYLPRGVRVAASPPTAIDLFAGCGGFSLGFLHAGFEVLAAVEWDVPACTTYWFNLCGPESRWVGDAKTVQKRDRILKQDLFNPLRTDLPPVRALICDDIHHWTGEQILALVGRAVGDVDCIMGGPPCQGFSYIGRRDVVDPRNSLLFEFARLVHEIKPKTFVMENVPGMVSMTTPSGQNVVSLLLRCFEDEGYLAVSQRLEDAIRKTKKDVAVAGMRVERKAALEAATIELADEDVQLSLF
jgi:DNA (cytosine-5)-methyltransferase 1